MKIKMNTPGRNGKDTFKAGAVIDVGKKEAEALIKRGLASLPGKGTANEDANGEEGTDSNEDANKGGE